MPRTLPRFKCGAIALLMFGTPPAIARLVSGEAHVWDVQEIILESMLDYRNPYAEVDCWIDLEGPGFAKRIHGFWDGGRTFRVRFVATAPGEWKWRTGSNITDDDGLNGGTGTLRAVAWSEAGIAENANRRGFVRASPNGHALVYADGTPFFLVGDTWLAASTWRLPYRGIPAAPDYVPGSGISFEEAVSWRKRQGYNSVSLIAAFPNWDADSHAATFANKDGVYLRNAWDKFGTWAPSAKVVTADGSAATAKDMQDENGNRPFEIMPNREGLADFDRINPAYFRSLDRKMKFLSDEGFVPVLGTVRRDHGPSWKAYFDFDRSYPRYVRYLVARYGAFNMIFSAVHLDWIPKDYSLTADEWNEALTIWHKADGPMPFGQPVTVLIDNSTYKAFGHGDACPWLTMQSVGTKPRDNQMYAAMEEEFALKPPYPVANLEPYYAGWNHMINRPGGETPEADSDRDNYFARSMMYGSVLSGGLAGHTYGTGAYDVTSTGEPEGWRPHIWTALRYKSGGQMQFMRDFVLSEGARYQNLEPASGDLVPRVAAGSSDDGLDGRAFMMRTADRSLALLYFENKALAPKVGGLTPGARYRWTLFNPRDGSWSTPTELTADANGSLAAPAIPEGGPVGANDWAAKLTRIGS